MVKIEMELDRLVVELMKRLRPLMMIDTAEANAGRQGMLTGPREISGYLGHRYGAKHTSKRYVNWYHKYGFPISKNPEGDWCTTKTLIDNWLQKRELMMRVYRQLGFHYPSGLYKDGKMRDVNPERMKPSEKTAVVVEINEQRAKEAMANAR